ncbi:MAG TPA: hypothetical protein VH024_17505 [Candidatus Angelobacter sp.]|jgi:hypothetical protein|nr:hypothetical protein [Candidatus Angelobacter sp.]
MATGFNYQTYRTALVTQIPSLVTDPNFQTILPACIDYAELSILRDLDFLVLHGPFSLGNTIISSATLPLPTNCIVLETLGYVQQGTVSPLPAPITPVSREFITAAFYGAIPGKPRYFAVIGAASGSAALTGWTPALQVLLGPTPDNTYAISGYGTVRPDPLSSSNVQTFISFYLPDLFWAASMIFLAGYNRNFGAQSDDPRQAISWESEYQRLLKGASVEEARRKYQAQAWTAQQPSAVATPPRA